MNAEETRPLGQRSRRQSLRYEGVNDEVLYEVVGVTSGGRLKVVAVDHPDAYSGRFLPATFARHFTWPGAAAGEPQPDGWIGPNDIEALLAAASNRVRETYAPQPTSAEEERAAIRRRMDEAVRDEH